MDKLWVVSNRLSTEFIIGLYGLITKSLSVAAHEGQLKCPCAKCYNRFWQNPSNVAEHMTVDGMDNDYAKGLWVYHGESRAQNGDMPSNTVRVADASLTDCGMRDMLNDVFRHGGEGNENEFVCEEPLPTNPTAEAEKFYGLLEDADKELYPGCRGLKKLDFLVHLYQIKCLHGVPDIALTGILLLIKSILPKGETLPKSFHLTRKLIKELGLTYKKIHACPNDCMIYWKDRALYDQCTTCGESRYKPQIETIHKSHGGKNNRVPQKVMRYFPLGPRLQRLYMSQHTGQLMTWHSNARPKDGTMRHPADSPAWKHLDTKYPMFAAENRNVRLGLASDGFNPFGNMSISHSTWPVIMCVYNLPPWLCMTQPYMMLSVLIPGPRGPGNDIDIFMEPLFDELKLLWEDGIRSYDQATKQQFTLRAAVLWTINDFPAYANLSGWSTKGKFACPYCNYNTCSKWLPNGHKNCYMGHRRFLPIRHRFRHETLSFNNKVEKELPPARMSGIDCLRDLSSLTFTFGKKVKKAAKRKTPEGPVMYEGPWKKQSIFFQLPYWKHLLLRHNLDVMHIEKNVCDSVVGTLLGQDGKTKDGMNARLDLEAWNMRPTLHPQRGHGRTLLPPALYTMSTNEKNVFCKLLASVRVPDGYASNVARCVNVKERKLLGLKSHDCHVILQQLLPMALRNTLPDAVTKVLIELCQFFRLVCSKSGTTDFFTNLTQQIYLILCKLEKIFPPNIFDVMLHLPAHLAEEAAMAGPVHYRWMYPIERYLRTLKQYVRNRSRPEGSIAEGYIVDECLSFCSMYLEDTETRRNRGGRNTDAGGRDASGGLAIFAEGGKRIGKGVGQVIQLDIEEKEKAHRCVLWNTPEVKVQIDQYVEDAIAARGRRTPMLVAERAANLSFPKWFVEHVNALDVDHNNIISEDIRAISKGPSEWCVRHTKFMVNGFRFRIKSLDHKGKNQNSGVFIKSSSECYASARDRYPKRGEVGYYGKVTDILELSYHAGRKVVLFRGEWVDTVNGSRGLKMDKYGFTLVNFNRLLNDDDPFILSSQAIQAFYVQDPHDEGWHIAIKTMPRDTFDMGDRHENESRICDDIDTNTEGTNMQHARMDMESAIVYEDGQTNAMNVDNGS